MKTVLKKIKLIATLALLLMPLTLMAQQERKYIRKGNRLFEKSNYAGSETQYHRAEGIDKPVPDATFNVGDALYKQKKYSEAAENFGESVAAYSKPEEQAEAYFNQGNALLKDNKFKESVEAYIKSLMISPDNMSAKYNLAYAQDQLKKQEEQQKKQDQENKDKQDQNKDDKKQQDQKQDQNKEKDQNKQNQDQNQDQQKQDQNKDQQQDQNKDQNQQNNEGDQRQTPRMSKDDAKRLLDALSANEKDVQEKVNKNKMSQAKVRVVKNW